MFTSLYRILKYNNLFGLSPRPIHRSSLPILFSRFHQSALENLRPTARVLDLGPNGGTLDPPPTWR